MLAVWAAQEGSNEPAADDALVLNLVFTAPDAEGTYFVNFTDLEIVDTDQNPLDYVKTNGAVIVKKDLTTAAATTVSDEAENLLARARRPAALLEHHVREAHEVGQRVEQRSVEVEDVG